MDTIEFAAMIGDDSLGIPPKSYISKVRRCKHGEIMPEWFQGPSHLMCHMCHYEWMATHRSEELLAILRYFFRTHPIPNTGAPTYPMTTVRLLR